MANHCDNTICIHNPTPEFLNKLKTEQDCKEVYVFDGNKFRPMPEILESIPQLISELGKYQAYEKVKSEYNEENPIDLEELTPDNLKNYFNNWYLENWGSNGGVTSENIDIDPEEDSSINFYLYSRWTPINILLVYIAEKYNISITNCYEEMGAGFVGKCVAEPASATDHWYQFETHKYNLNSLYNSANYNKVILDIKNTIKKHFEEDPEDTYSWETECFGIIKIYNPDEIEFCAEYDAQDYIHVEATLHEILEEKNLPEYVMFVHRFDDVNNVDDTDFPFDVHKYKLNSSVLK